MIQENIELYSKKINKAVSLGIISDFHNAGSFECLDYLHGVDFILMPGDIVDHTKVKKDIQYENALKLFEKAVKIAPVYYSLGNHEHPVHCPYYDEIAKLGVGLLNAFTTYNEEYNIIFGGLLLPVQTNFEKTIKTLENSKGFSILLSHRPEIYPDYFKNRAIDLVVSGHSHGGQIKIFNRGIYSTTQGFFPKYTDGLYENSRLLVSPGVTNNHTLIPRINNPTKVIILKIKKSPRQ